MPLIGDITAKKLINHFGSAENVFAQKRQNLEKVIGIGAKISKNFASADYLRQAEAELTFCQQHNIRIFTYTDPDYPALLGQCLDSPVVFYQRGNVNLTNKRILSVVGTRQVTPYGIATCEQLIEALAPLGVVVVSGLAYGVDITAHKAAVKHKLQTVACLAHGLHIIYPKVHSKYCAEIMKSATVMCPPKPTTLSRMECLKPSTTQTDTNMTAKPMATPNVAIRMAGRDTLRRSSFSA